MCCNQEDGTHDELIAKEGVYYQLVVSQGTEPHKQQQQQKKIEKLTDLTEEDGEQDDKDKMQQKADIWMPDVDEYPLPGALVQSTPTPFGRTPSVRSSSRSRSSRHSISKVSEPSSSSAVEEPIENVSLMKIIRMNKSEWPFIVIGVLGSIVVGLSTPLYAILFSEVFGALASPDKVFILLYMVTYLHI